MNVTFNATGNELHLLSIVSSRSGLFAPRVGRLFVLLLLLRSLWLDDGDGEVGWVLEGIIEERGEGDSIGSRCRRRRGIGEVHWARYGGYTWKSLCTVKRRRVQQFHTPDNSFWQRLVNLSNLNSRRYRLGQMKQKHCPSAAVERVANEADSWNIV